MRPGLCYGHNARQSTRDRLYFKTLVKQAVKYQLHGVTFMDSAKGQKKLFGSVLGVDIEGEMPDSLRTNGDTISSGGSGF